VLFDASTVEALVTLVNAVAAGAALIIHAWKARDGDAMSARIAEKAVDHAMMMQRSVASDGEAQQ